MNAAEYLSKKKVNIEILLWCNDKNVLHYGIRLRPWKQESLTPKMILVQGLSVDDALNVAAAQLYIEAWQVLDYSLRAWAGALPTPSVDETPEQFDFLDAERLPTPLFAPKGYGDKGPDLKRRQLRP